MSESAAAVKVVSLSPLWGDELARRIARGITLVTVDPSDTTRLGEELPSAHILITPSFDRAMAALCRSLELVICPAAGTEGIDREALPEGVVLRNGVGHEIPMAEYVIGSLVALRQGFAAADAALRQGRWIQGFFGTREMAGELYGSTLALLGFGRIGMQTAIRAKAFGMHVEAATAHPDARGEGTLDGALASLMDGAAVDRLLARADAVVVACELSPLTRGLVDARRLGLMRRDAVLVNVARGPIVEEQALFEALRDRRIAGAALDVWYCYPERRGETARPSRAPFEQLDNVLMTPHSSGWTQGAKERKLAFLSASIAEFARSRR